MAITDDASVSDPDTITALCQRVLDMAAQHLLPPRRPSSGEYRAWRRLQAAAYNNMGVAADYHGDAARSLTYYKQALRIREQIRDQRGQLESHHNVGLMCSDHNDLVSAMHHFDVGLHLAETLNDSVWIGIYSRTLGALYGELGEPARQLAYLRHSLRVLRGTPDVSNQAEASVLLAVAYRQVGRLDSATLLMRQGLILGQRIGDLTQVSVAQRWLGIMALQAGYPDSAEFYLQQAVRAQRALSYNAGLAPTLAALGAVRGARHQWAAALDFTTQAAKLARTSGTQVQKAEIEQQFSQLYQASGQPAAALAHFQRFVGLRDSIRAEQSLRTVLRLRLQAEATQREAILRAQQDKVHAVAAAEIRRQKDLRNVWIGSALALLTLAGLLAQRFWASQRARRALARAKQAVERERDRADELLLNILPADTAAELKATGRAQARQHEEVTVLFCDVINFTQLAEGLPPQDLVSTLDAYFAAFDQLCGNFGLEKIKTIGDAYLLAGGLNGRPTHAPQAVVRCALAMQAAAQRLSTERTAAGLPHFQMRIGIHTGPVVAGIVGIRKFAYDIWGDTVNTAARMEQGSAAGKVNLSETTYRLVAADFRCEPRGYIEAKHKGAVAMYFVEEEW